MDFRSVDPSRNRHRRYSVAVQYRIDGGGELIITWGRLGRPPRQRIERFDTHVQLQRRYAALVARRRRHGYELVSSAPSFSSPTLTMDTATRFIAMLQKNGYLGLFDTRLHTFVIRDVAPDIAPGALRDLTGQVLKQAQLLENGNVDAPAANVA